MPCRLGYSGAPGGLSPQLEDPDLNISILGAGYVGLVTAACLAKLRNRVVCIDSDGDRVDRVRRLDLHIHEPGLPDLLGNAMRTGLLSFETELAASAGSTLIIVCVGTLSEEGEWTDRYVRLAVDSIVRHAEAPRWIVIRSTLMPGTGRSIAEAARGVDPEVEILVNPEFTREGTAVADFFAPDRLIIGIESGRAAGEAARTLRRLYEPLEAPLVVSDLTSAETIKVASNVFLATKIAFANELVRLCEASGSDVQSVVDGIGLDRRIGRAFLSPGPGYGGSCLPSQARALPGLTLAKGVETPILDAIDRSNEAHSRWLVEQARQALGETLAGRRVGLLGLTFKAGTDDLRESPSLRIAGLLLGQGATVAGYDPMVSSGPRSHTLEALGLELSSDTTGACRDADLVIVATEWPDFGLLDWQALAAVMRGRLVIDARHVVDADAAASAGLTVLTLGSAGHQTARTLISC